MKLIILLVVLASFVANSLAQKNSYVCGLPSSFNPGRCLALLPVWSYDSSKNKCVEFIYGGCGGNGNRFGSMKDCIDTCVQ